MKQWTIDLSKQSIETLIRDLDTYTNEVTRKLDMLVTRLLEEGVQTINSTSRGYVVDSYFRVDHTSFSSEHCLVTGTLVAEGEDLLWIEFGTGVYFNGQAGTSPHPDGNKLGMRIGEYGKHNGRRKEWYYYEPQLGQCVATNGIKAKMPVYKANIKIVLTFLKVAQEVFGVK